MDAVLGSWNVKKPALQAILIAPNDGDRAAIINGRKTATVREGSRNYHIGPVMLCCHLVPWAVMADIWEVVECPLFALSQRMVEADGFDSLEHLLADLRKYYPELQLDSPVTFVRWENVRGALVDSAKRAAR